MFTGFLIPAGVYVTLSIFGFFAVPAFFPRERIFRCLEVINRKETASRDNFLLKLTAPIARAGIHPTAITVFGFFLIVGLASALYFNADKWLIFFLTFFAGLSDMFDGAVARVAGKITVLGGILDGLRDFCLFLVLTVRFLWEGFVSYKIFLWFFIGALFIENFKLLEILARQKKFSNLSDSFKNRFAGQGKLSIDRTKYFFYVLASLVLIIEEAVGTKNHHVSIVIFWFAIAAIFISIVAHAAAIRLESTQKSL